MRFLTLNAALSLLLLVSNLSAQVPSARTTITVPTIHCMACARKMGAEIKKVPGVEKVLVDLKAKALIVQHQTGASPSPQALWTAVETAGYQPTLLDGAAGRLTASTR